ncbi:MAG: 2-amino-4-hydroxy-6-hydroxymethyldihydropteridine diphosphokinase [Eubacteriales bacterium]|nr:2-amino-4-hydroxy-6-hydroxymethyldihydropteridine diphosphokinase [Eubacteriales bacterium]
MDKIFIKNLEVFANHGVFPEETALGQKFVVSAELLTDTREAGRSDDLSRSVHYGEVSEFITEYLQKHTFKLIEAAAENLAEELLLDIPGLKGVTIELKKPWAPVHLPLETVGVSISRSWHRAYIALGSNMGDSRAYLDMAVRKLNETRGCRVLKTADYIVTKPYGGIEQDDFLNSALEMDTLLTPYELLEELHRIENAAGRKRIVRWGPRTLDLDILMYDDIVLDAPELHIPHIEMHKRDFVLEPMCCIAPYLRHPVYNRTMEQLKGELYGKQSDKEA